MTEQPSRSGGFLSGFDPAPVERGGSATQPAWASLASNFRFIRQLSKEEVERMLERGRG